MAQFEVQHRYHSQGLAAGGSALLDAVNKGKTHLAKFILDAGEYDIVNTRDFKGKTPLIRASYLKDDKARVKLVQLLLSKGAAVNLQDEHGRTALSYACEYKCNDVVKTLIRNNVEPDIPDNSGNTPLMYSAMVGNSPAIDALIRSFRRLGLNVDHANKQGMTALLLAGKNGHINCATALSMDGRANLTIRDPLTGKTAEELARSAGCSSPEVQSLSPDVRQNQLRLSKGPSLYSSRSPSPISPGLDPDPQSSGIWSRDFSTAVGEALKAGEEAKSRLILKGRRPRYKRCSLPCIKLHSSLDSPTTYQDPPTMPRSPKTFDAGADSTSLMAAAAEGGETSTSIAPHQIIQLPSRLILGPRRSRELIRADTEVFINDDRHFISVDET